MMAVATARQPGQHIGRSTPSMMTEKDRPGGTAKPQWKHGSTTLAIAVAALIRPRP
jgi:hypothetical protein